jgi:acetoin utilization protein AcuB
MLVEEAMTAAVVTLTPDETLRDAINLLRSKRIRHLPVIEATRLVGIVTDRDVKRATPSVLSGVAREDYDHALVAIKVAQFMTRDPITVTRKSGLKAAVEIFIERKVGALPVVDDDELVGILTEIDILRVAYDLLPD